MNVLNTVVEVSKKNMHLFILAIYAYVLFQIEDNDFATMILLTSQLAWPSATSRKVVLRR